MKDVAERALVENKQEEEDMSRERMTGKVVSAEAVEAAVVALEKAMTAAADEAGLEQAADKASKEDMKAVSESVPAGKPELKDQGDQNAKANANWKLTDAERNKVAAKLVKMAKAILDA